MGKIVSGKMKKLLLGTIPLTASVLLLPLMAVAGLDIHIPLPPPPQIHISVPAPPRIRFPEPPRLVVLPETHVYVAPDIDEDIFFYDGWWWRPWEGRWYRSRQYDSGWYYYRSEPSFYRQVRVDWRNDYREHQWRGHRWEVEPIHHREVQKNWRTWRDTNHWESHGSWGVQGLREQGESRRPYRGDRY